MFFEHVLDDPVCQPVAKRYKQWCELMEQNIEFWLPDSVKHTKVHCARVLLLALVIAHQMGLSDEEKDTLSMAAIFHDSRRLDDWLDKGHGKRAAEYYQNYCYDHDTPFDKQTYYIMYYHDQDDVIGLSEIRKALTVSERCTLLYQIFKDADALDRFRLAPDALDVNMLRTEKAHKLIDFAKYLLHKSNEV